MESAAPVLKVEDLSISYETRGGAISAVDGVSFEVHSGETVGIVGESGCGKSTIAFGIVNFLGKNGKITNGSIQFQGRELVGCPHKELQRIRGNRISMVYQDPMQALNPVLRIGEQLTEVLTFHQDISKEDAWKQSVEMLSNVYMPDPEIVMNRYPHQLSGGQQQRVVIAMAMLNQPALLIMDEPTTALDVTVEAVVLDLVEDLMQDFNTGIIYITHNLGVIARVSDNVCVMYAGEIVESGSAEDIFRDPSHPYTIGLLRCIPSVESAKNVDKLYNIEGRVPTPAEKSENTCIFFPRCDFSQPKCRERHYGLKEVAPGHLVRCAFGMEELEVLADKREKAGQAKQEDTGPAEVEVKTILSTRDLRVYYEQKSKSILRALGLGERQYIRAVDGISLDVMKGKTLGVVGESGCGKSTLAKGLIGLEKVTGGEAEFLGFDISQPLSKRALELIREIQMVFQNPDSTLNPSFIVGKQISRPLKRFKSVPSNQVRREVERLLSAVRLGETYYKRYPRQLSGGEKQRIGIARALASQPELLLCDEAVSALDVSVQAAVLNLLNEIQQASGCGMIFISHDLSVVRFFSEYIAVMYLGQIVEFGPSESIFSPPFHPYTEALLSAVPVPDPAVQHTRVRLMGEVPSSLNPPEGCRFHTRCPRRNLLPDDGKMCENQFPPLKNVNDDHRILCHLPLDVLSRIQSKAEER